MNGKKKAAVVGLGGQGGWHAYNIVRSDVVELTGIADPADAARERARNWGYKIYETNEEVFRDPDVDIVVIATPNDVHEEIALSAIAAGKHVICEKPVMMSAESLEKVIAAAEEKGVKFSAHQNRRWDTDYRIAKKVMESGKLGDIISYESRVHGSRGIPGDWRTKKAQGGGMVYDWAVHMIDQALWALGYDVDSVHCTLDFITAEEVDDGCQITIMLKSGIRIFVEIGTRNFRPLSRLYVRGVWGTVEVPSWETPAKVSLCKEWVDGEVVPVQTAAGITKTMAPRSSGSVEHYEVPQDTLDVHDYYRNFVKAIDGEEELIVKPAEMLKVMQVIDAAFKSAETNSVVKF